MIILHTAYDGQLVLWGETPVGESDPVNAPSLPDVAGVQSSPFDPGKTVIRKATKLAVPALKLFSRQAVQTNIWLPTVRKIPVPSSPLIGAETPRGRAKPRLAQWIVTGYPLTTAQTVELLCACADRRMLAPGVLVGPDLAWFAEALRFAGSLVARQQFLPGIHRHPEGHHTAEWEPVIAGDDALHLSGLAKRMPSSARCVSRQQADAPPETPAEFLAGCFITDVVDFLVRSVSSQDQVRNERGRGEHDSVHDAWCDALQAEDPRLDGKDSLIAELATQAREWRRPIEISAKSPFRLCFRLEEPEPSEEDEDDTRPIHDGEWYVRYLLQPVDDPSLLVPMEKALKVRGRKPTALKGRLPEIREYVLTAMGQAAGLCPQIANALERELPDGHGLSLAAAHRFMRETSGTLEQAGFGVLLPAWWTRTGTKLQLTARSSVSSPKLQASAGLTLDTVVAFDWKLAIGDEELSARELETLARLKTPLVKLRGHWVEVTASEVKAAAAFWDRKGSSESATVRDIVKMARGGVAAVDGLPFGGVEATGWVGDLLEQLEAASGYQEEPLPGGFHGTLRPYQVKGYSWLSFLRRWELGACLADDMGLGKTIQTLALIMKDWEANGKQPVLLACPTSVMTNWRKEAARFTPDLPVMVHHGPGREKGAAFKKQALAHALVVTSYGLLQRDIKRLQMVLWSGVVLDEAQNIKNPQTRQARTARALQGGYRIALTGTPVENNVGDLWSIMEFLNPGFLGSLADFKRRFFIPIQTRHDPAATDRLRRITAPFVLRRLKTDRSIISDLPDKVETNEYCTLTKEQASLYAAVVTEAEEAITGAEGIGRKGVVLATLSKLKQVCNHPVQFLGDNSAVPGRSGKLSRLMVMLEELLEVGGCALVFTQFAEMGKIIQRHIQEMLGQEVLFLHGGVTKTRRDKMIERFQSDGGPPIFLLSLKAGGTGLNLTRANHVFHFDRWWNPAVENQATDRAFRIGQRRNVQVHKFVCAGTVEERIDEMIEKKKALAEKVVGTGEAWLTELSNIELKALFALHSDAIGD